MSYLENSPDHFDPVRPGEQWFFYWKTSAALWESRIMHFAPGQVIFLPLNWGFHAETSQRWDFGELHPERDLGRLMQLLTQHGRKYCWILPLTPAPFLPNGGIPAAAARTLSVAAAGTHLAVLDQEKKLNKIFSFFEPKVFQLFCQFCKAWRKELDKHKVKAPVWGATFSYSENNQLSSYLEDNSLTFEQGFSRYLKQNFPQGTDLTDPYQEERLKQKFTQQVLELFTSAAESELTTQWGGIQNMVVLGGGCRDTIERAMTVGRSEAFYFHQLLNHYVHNRWITSCLLYNDEKKDLLNRFLTEHFGPEEIAGRFRFHADQVSEWQPLHLIDIFEMNQAENLKKNGLTHFLDANFRWMYQIYDQLEFTPGWIEKHQNNVKIFHGSSLDRQRFNQMLKLFMMGQRIILDRSGLTPELERRLQVFLMENELKLQSVKFKVAVGICHLGEGQLIMLEGALLAGDVDQGQFWQQIFRYLNLNQPQVQMDDDVFSLWKIRFTSTHELNYLDVRRINLYNPTSYRKSVSIKTQKHFAFMKMIDPLKASAKSTPQGVEVELLPHGKIALDFGHYEEA